MSVTTKGANTMIARNCMTDALEIVLAWDIPDRAMAHALNAQADFLAELPSDELCYCPY
jgi:hypothetical protein